MPELAEYGYWGLFIASFLSATVIPFSSELLLSYLLVNGLSVEVCILSALSGNWLGGMSGFYLGKLGRLDSIDKILRIKQERIQKYENRVNKYGSILAFMAWAPFIGDIIAVALGYFKCRALPVSLWMLLGKMLRYIVFAVLTLKLAM